MLSEYPPYAYLKQAANHCPKAISTYLELWSSKNDKFTCSISKEDIPIQFLSLVKFKHDLNLLLKEGLLSYQEKKGNFFIELTAWDDNFDEDMVC